jgi:predicted lipid-binding transport protein (Tim44 family)
LNQATKSGVAAMIANPENKKRTAGIWLSGLLGCLILGGFISYLFGRNDWLFGAIGLTLLFVCFRLWMREKRIE